MTIWRSMARASAVLVCAISFAGSALAADPAPAPAKKAEAPKPVIKAYGTWHTSCVKNEKKVEECHAFVQVATKEKQVVLYLGIGYARAKEVAGKLAIFSITPLGTMLPSGIVFAVDGKELGKRPFLYCAPNGCRSDGLVGDAELKTLKAGKELELTFTVLPVGEIKIPIKLDGFSAALKALPAPK